MPLQRLRQVLGSNYRVKIESSDELLAKVNLQINKRRQALEAEGKPVPPSKPTTVVAAFQPEIEWDIRPIDLLHKIGFLTTPSGVNMSRLSASWATRRYFWAIAEPNGQQPPLRLSEDARNMDFHQKTLLSDEFGIGIAGLLVENFFQAASFVDVSVALDDPAAYQDIQQQGTAQPDYLMWNPEDNSPYYVVECKGTQSTRAESYNQLRRGLEQVPSVVLGAGPRQVMTLVVAACMLPNGTEVFVIDPPPGDSEDDQPKTERTERVSERTGKRSWRISNPEAFRERTVIAEESSLLKWAGQYQTASVRDRRLERVHREQVVIPNVPLEEKRTDVGVFRGFEQPLFPALSRNVRLFTGVEEAVLERVSRELPPDAAIDRDLARIEQHARERARSNVSVSRNGTCMILEGL